MGMIKQEVAMNDRRYIKHTNPDAIFEIPLGYEYELQNGPGRLAAGHAWGAGTGAEYFGTQADFEKWKPKVLEGFNVSRDSLDWGINKIGWEIRSLVAPLRMQRVLWDKIYAENLANGLDLEQVDLEHMGAGIHVHVENNAKTVENAHKVINFLHGGPRDKFLKLSERTKYSLDKYARADVRPNVTAETVKNRQRTEQTNYLTGHYEIITMESPKTFEIRWFAARPHLMPVALEAADSLFRMGRDVDAITMENWSAYTAGKARYAKLHAAIQAAA